MRVNQAAETAEREVYDLLKNVIQKHSLGPTLVIHGFKFDRCKCQALMQENHRLEAGLQAFLAAHRNGGECDFLVIVKDLGVVFVEVGNEITVAVKQHK